MIPYRNKLAETTNEPVVKKIISAFYTPDYMYTQDRLTSSVWAKVRLDIKCIVGDRVCEHVSYVITDALDGVKI